jgi:hypothetical protein
LASFRLRLAFGHFPGTLDQLIAFVVADTKASAQALLLRRYHSVVVVTSPSDTEIARFMAIHSASTNESVPSIPCRQ